MTGAGAKARQKAKREAWLKNYDPGFKCKVCGHSEMIHYYFVGRCIHNEMKPKDGSTCDCQSMDGIALIKGEQ